MNRRKFLQCTASGLAAASLSAQATPITPGEPVATDKTGLIGWDEFIDQSCRQSQ